VQAGGEQSPADADEAAERDRAKHRTDEPMIEQESVPSIHRDVVRVLLDGRRVVGLAHVIEHVAQLHRPKALQPRAVRIAVLVRKRMVLSVDGHPLLRGQSGRDPQRESEQPGDRRMQRQRAMRGAAMQVNRRAEGGDLGETDGDHEADDQS